MRHTIVCLSFKPFVRNTLRGFAKVRVNELSLVINDIMLHEKGDSRWASLPGKPQLRDGKVVTDPNTGRAAYVSILEFEGREARDAFSEAVWSAVEKTGALEDLPL